MTIYINTHLFIYIPVELFYSFDPVMCSERPELVSPKTRSCGGCWDFWAGPSDFPEAKNICLFVGVSTIAISTIKRNRH